ncbi:MAG: MogA/MoaB family molybdenum cofactor biosynthesis protein [Myxococcota bacterium]
MTHHKHHARKDHHAHDEQAPAPIAVITVSDTRTSADDTSGATLRDKLQEAGFHVGDPVIVKDEPWQIRVAIEQALNGGARAVILNGGTGLAPRDGTPEVVEKMLDKPLPGFGELFRMLSFQEIGAAAMLSRAVAGTRGRALLVSLPGSTAAVRLAAEKLLVPQLRHILGLLSG